ncbi:IS21-like element helper ATPase IstB [Adlercreutzia equolifaciens]|uniref:IS21-like element helper ATPase IstB n=1 Tax=Adlercreutzia equolifaciens TaxID=446660 RepID=UPI0039F59E08
MDDVVVEASPYARAQNNLATLKLDQMAAALPDYMRMVSGGEMEFVSALAEMTAAEVLARKRRILSQRIRSSGLPCVKTLADFDWSFQPSVPRSRIEGLATLRFIDEAENVLFVGSPGVGKTHLAIALGVEAVRAGREVRFMDCARLVDDLKDAQARGILKKRLKYYAHSKLLIIDELGYLDIGESGADLLFQLISMRYEQRSTIITTNVGIGGWGGVFGDEVAASAIADRVCHHCSMVKITGRSYRLKDLPAEKKREQ